MFLSDEGPTFKTLDFTFYIGSTPTFLYFDLYFNTAYAAHYILCFSLTKGLRSKRLTLLSISAVHQPFYIDLYLNTAYTQHTTFYVSLWRRAYAQNVRLCFLYQQYTNLFIFRFAFEHCLRNACLLLLGYQCILYSLSCLDFWEKYRI